MFLYLNLLHKNIWPKSAHNKSCFQKSIKQIWYVECYYCPNFKKFQFHQFSSLKIIQIQFWSEIFMQWEIGSSFFTNANFMVLDCSCIGSSKKPDLVSFAFWQENQVMAGALLGWSREIDLYVASRSCECQGGNCFLILIFHPFTCNRFIFTSKEN